jgi:predicted glycoside hydrolase/deacetylase ChbG (UPF0249 family)
MIIVNADDWGRSELETDAAYYSFSRSKVSSATAMVFMSDSKRASELALQSGLPVGLHVNLTEQFSAPPDSPSIRRAQGAIACYLNRGRFAKAMFNPAVARSLGMVFRAQLDEFRRLYGQEPSHFDGHQHMHLCANMAFSGALPRGAKVRRSLSYVSGEKNVANLLFRALVDKVVGRRCVQTDYFFDLAERRSVSEFTRLCQLAQHHTVEVMCHPARPDELAFLESTEFAIALASLVVSSYHNVAGASARG